MDRRQLRRETLFHAARIEEQRDKLTDVAASADGDGEVIAANELRRQMEKLTDLLDAMYVWAGNL